MDQIRTQLENISELSNEELQSLKESVFTEYKAVKPKDETAYTAEVVETLTSLADAKDAINTELQVREQKAAELAELGAAATSRLDESEEEPAEEVAEEETAEEAPKKDEEDEEASKKTEFSNSEPAEEKVADPESAPKSLDTEKVDGQQGAVEAASEKETVEVSTEPTTKMPYGDVDETAKEDAVASHDVPEESMPNEHPQSSVDGTASTDTNPESSEEPVSTNEDLNKFSAPEENEPAAKPVAVRTITASADFGNGIKANQQLTSLRQVAQGIVNKRRNIGSTAGADNENLYVATFSTEYPEDRLLHRSDIEGNKEKIDAVVSPEAIVAAGGLTAPVETSYDIFNLGETDARPVRDSLPKFGADRGGIRFLTAPTIADLDGAVSVWTLQNDIDAASPEAPNPVKPCLRVAAGQEVEVFVDAIPLCLTFGNLASRAYPELVERHIRLGMVWHARFAETRLITRIGQLSTPVTAPAVLGAARDIFSQIEVAASAYRSRYRIDPDATLRVMFPEWFKNALRSDLIKQLPGDGRDGTFNLGEAEINSWFAARNIVVTWFLDGEEGQIFGAQTEGTTDGTTGVFTPAALDGFPETLVWYMFSEGTFLFLDAGTLDLGLVRDSTLNGTNDYKIFLETFEGVAKVGIESLRIESALSIRGSSSGTTDVAVGSSV